MVTIRKLLQSDYLILTAILGLAFFIAFIPHRNYPYPLHVDEWVHMARSQAMLHAGSVTFIDPFPGGETTSLSTNLEAGFQLFWAAFQSISGISWLTIFRYFPSIIFIFTVLSVYIMTQREGFGLEAASFTLLVPTTVGILGPAFLVPVSLGLFFTPLLLFLALNFNDIRSYVLIFILNSFLLAIHAPSAICPVIILAPYILLNLKSNFKHALGLTLALLLPFLIIFPWIASLVFTTARNLFTQQPLTEYVQLPRILQDYGYLPLSFCLLGTFSLAMKGDKKSYGLALGFLALLLMLVSFFTFHYGVPIVYERGLMYMMLMAGIIAGAGLATVRNLKLPEGLTNRLRVPAANQYAGRFLCLAIAITVLVLTIPQRLNTPYYHMIDEVDYQAFIWIKNNIAEANSKTILDPWKATAFTAITGRQAYSRIHVAPLETDNIAYDFLRNGSTNTTFLVKNGISVIYTRVYDGNQGTNVTLESKNPDLIKVAENIYFLKTGPAGQ